MNSNISSTDPEIVARISLYKALLYKKSNLYNEVNQMKIKKSYLQSNSEYKDFKDVQALTKVLSKRLAQIRHIRQYLNDTSNLSKRRSSLNDFQSLVLSLEQNLEVPRHIFSLNFEKENQIDSLQTTYEDLAESFQQKLSQSELYEEMIQSIPDEKKEELESLQQEISEFQQAAEQLSKINYLMREKRALKLIKRKSSLDNLRVYNKLSENGLRLKSKIMLKKDLKDNMRTVLNGFENTLRIIEESKRKIKSQENLEDYKRELQGLVERQKALEERISALYKEKNSLVSLFPEKSLKGSYCEGDETVLVESFKSRLSSSYRKNVGDLENRTLVNSILSN